MSSTDNPMRDKICLVCGDKALGYNFNAVSCESCKAFFRRNALKDKEFKCPFNKKCEITTVTRRFCQFCRLIKCFDVGMKKEYIMTDEEKKNKRDKVWHKKGMLGADGCEEDVSPKRTKLINEDSMSSDHKINKLQFPEDTNKTQPIVDTKLFQHSNDSVDHCSERVSDRFNLESNSVTQELQKYFTSRNNDSNENENSTIPSTRTSLSSPIRSLKFDGRHQEGHFLERASSSLDVPSPNMLEPSSPVGSALAGIRSSHHEGNQSRPVEIYQISKAFDSTTKTSWKTSNDRHCNPNILKQMLCTKSPEFSKEPQEKAVSASSPGGKQQNPLLSSLMGTGSSSSQRDRGFRHDLADEVFSDIPDRNDEMGHSIDSILTEAIKLEYEAYSSMNPRINSRELNDAERAKLNELIVANKALLAPLDDDVSSDMTQAMSKDHLGVKPMLVDVLNLTAVAIRRLIKMAKKVNAFKNMCQQDQIALLKGGATEMMILRSAMTYDSDRGSWKIPQSAEKLMNIKVDVLKEAGGRVFDEHQRFLQTFDPKWRNDENLMLILSAITLFTPHRPKVVHHDVIKLEQNSYYYLLRRYLESIYPGCEARSTFLQLIQKISELHRLNQDHVRVYMDLNPEDVEPLLIEIFDLKHSLDT